MKRKSTILMFLLCTFLYSNAQWNLVWSDEFNGTSLSSDWVIETGTGSNGWGNAETQYYRAENITVSGGALHITAKNENFGGQPYTSGRMKTQGKQSFKYGKIEARIAMPSFNGVWPAFWMLGDNITSVGWPKCGEIDIMEHVNTGGDIHGTIHWDNNGYASYGQHTSTNITSYHVYSIEWDDQYIRWFLDGVKYNEVLIANNTGGTEEFHNKFFLILNMAIGGRWPGYNIDAGAMPAEMVVDYVRVYQQGNGGTTHTIPGTVEAEAFSAMNGIQTENCSEGGQNVGWIDNGDWLDYSVNVQQSGTYNVNFRVAADGSAGKSVQLQSGGSTLGTATFTATGGWQNWTNASVNVNLNAGTQVLRVYAPSTGFNINYIDFTYVGGGSFSTRIEAENYADMNGIQTEACSQGGLNVGWIDAGDWIVWDVDLPRTTTYTIKYNIASQNGGGIIQFEKAGGNPVYGTIGVPSTGGWQNWQIISHNVNLSAGQQQVAIYAPAGGYNINWIEIIEGANKSGKIASSNNKSIENASISLYPNPVKERLNIKGVDENAELKVFNLSGQLLLEETGNTINTSNLLKGIYVISVKMNEEIKNIKFSKN